VTLGQIPATLWSLFASVALTCALFPGYMGWGTYSPTGLALVALSGGLCLLAVHAGRRTSNLPTYLTTYGNLWPKFWAIAVIFVFLAVYAVRITPAEETDVYLWQRDAVAAFLHGTDPYAITHENIFGAKSWYFYPPGIVSNGRVQFGLAYPPLSVLMSVPGYLFGDLRYSDIAALLATAIFLFRLRSNKFSLITAAVLLLSPATFYLVARGFSEPFVLLTLACTVVAAEKKSRWLPLALAAFISSKQYAVLALPFAGFLIPGCTWKSYVKLVAAATLASLVLCLPFVIWSPYHFWRDLVVFSFAVPFRPDSLSFSALTARLGWGLVPALVTGVAVLTACIWCLAKAARSAAMFATCFAFVLLVLLSLHKQAFINYYFTAIGGLLVAGVAGQRQTISIRDERVAATSASPSISR
jgi:hypothetical protein